MADQLIADLKAACQDVIANPDAYKSGCTFIRSLSPPCFAVS